MQDYFARTDLGSVDGYTHLIATFARAVLVTVTSADPTYAFDNNVRTWWEPSGDDAQPWLMLDLGSRNNNDPNQEFLVDSTRILCDVAAPCSPRKAT